MLSRSNLPPAPLLSGCLLLLSILALLFGFVDPRNLTDIQFFIIQEGVHTITFVLSAFVFFLTFYILITVGDLSIGNKVLELISVASLLLSAIIAYAWSYRFGYVISKDGKTFLGIEDALYYSVAVFTGNAPAEFTPSSELQMLFSAESMLGYFVTPILIGVMFIVAQGATSSKRDSVK
jgi:hypothetical protein